MYTCKKNGLTFMVKDEKTVKIYKAAGYTVEEAAEKKATKAKSKAKAKAETIEAVEVVETTDTAE